MRNIIVIAAAAAASVVQLIAPPADAQVPPPPRQVTIQIVATPPPPLRVESRAPAPAAGAVWSDGYWDWRGAQWVWVQGSWARPPAPGAAWVHAEYVPVDGGYRYVPAHWSTERVVEVDRLKAKHDNGKHKGWYKKDRKREKHED